ncbi:hypothetical protein J8L85_15995 [Maribacter sp. MMG018]|uniref:hypothetical protein n=1 Tax=Maribacter sp. MMG018 TaxID=2822688 RepID=UPI001B390341|nr:hypothetical protein [Maribacter sp. MMG018]MBQ4915958.1 hypothetical protein [Maribacter sp. MMG018]
MKKSVYMFLFCLMTIGVALSCREEKTAGEKIEDGVEEIGDGIEEGAEEIEDEIDDATDDHQ